MDLEAAGPGLYLLAQGQGGAGMALGQKAHVHGHGFHGFEHTVYVPFPGGDGRAVRAVRRAYAAAEERGHAVGNGGLALLRGNEVDVRIDAAGRKDEVLAGNGVRGVAHHEFRAHAVHDSRIARLTYARYHAVAYAHVGLDDALHGVHDGHVSDDDIQHAAVAPGAGIAAHTGAKGLAAAVDGLVAVAAQVLFDFHVKVGVAKADAVPHGGAEQRRVFFS